MNGFSERKNPTIDRNYLDGISLTHGESPRHHIWSFAVNWNRKIDCAQNRPSFVGNDFFYATGTSNNKLLWDGTECVGNTCCTHGNPPWFYKELSQPTTDDIEMRVCRQDNRSQEDVRIETIEIFVQ